MGRLRDLEDRFDTWFDAWYDSKSHDAQIWIALSPLWVTALVAIIGALVGSYVSGGE